MISFKYKGRTYTNGRSLTAALNKDLKDEYERKIRQAASASGVRVQRTSRGFQFTGDANSMARMNKRLGN
ncbi:hypothetical protein ACXN5S_18485 [Pseudoroseicyclus sp. H15]